jgi:hypothetical protein
LQPLLDIREGIYWFSFWWNERVIVLTAVCDVVDDNDTVSTPVVRRGDGPETFLSSGIPLLDQRVPGIVKGLAYDLKLDSLSL